MAEEMTYQLELKEKELVRLQTWKIICATIKHQKAMKDFYKKHKKEGYQKDMYVQHFEEKGFIDEPKAIVRIEHFRKTDKKQLEYCARYREKQKAEKLIKDKKQLEAKQIKECFDNRKNGWCYTCQKSVKILKKSYEVKETKDKRRRVYIKGVCKCGSNIGFAGTFLDKPQEKSLYYH